MAKRLERMRLKAQGWSFDDVRGLLEHYGCECVPKGGSHFLFFHELLDDPCEIVRQTPELKGYLVKAAVEFVDLIMATKGIYEHEDTES